MATTTISISDQAYKALKSRKEPGESFSETILRELPPPFETLGDLEDYYSKAGVPPANPKRKALLRGAKAKR